MFRLDVGFGCTTVKQVWLSKGLGEREGLGEGPGSGDIGSRGDGKNSSCSGVASTSVCMNMKLYGEGLLDKIY